MTEQECFLKYLLKYNINVFKHKTKSVGCIFKNITFKLSYETFHQLSNDHTNKEMFNKIHFKC